MNRRITKQKKKTGRKDNCMDTSRDKPRKLHMTGIRLRRGNLKRSWISFNRSTKLKKIFFRGTKLNDSNKQTQSFIHDENKNLK